MVLVNRYYDIGRFTGYWDKKVDSQGVAIARQLSEDGTLQTLQLTNLFELNFVNFSEANAGGGYIQQPVY